MLKDKLYFVSSNYKLLIIYGFLTSVICLLVFPIGLYFYLHLDFNHRASNAVTALNQKMDRLLIELKDVVEDTDTASAITTTCNQSDLKRLQRKVFYSTTFKEIGLFDADFRIYCTSLGSENFVIFKTISQRIKQSLEHKTVSLVRSKTLNEQTFFVFYQAENGLGVNGLAPPADLTKDLAWLLMPDYPYELEIGMQKISSQTGLADVEMLDKQVLGLNDWSIYLSVFLPKSLYWTNLQQLIPYIIVSWFVIYFALHIGHFSFVQYRRSLQYGIKKAIKNNEIEVHFQPIVALNCGHSHKMEALIRWHSKYHGQVHPLTIVEVSYKLRLTDELTWMVIRKLGDFYRRYPQQLKTILTAVNVDRQSLVKDTFIADLMEILGEYPELKGKLGLEVTETSALTAIELPLMVSRFDQIKALGIALSVDDFGTGYSGLDFLRRFPYDTLKLDRVFIASLKDDPFTRQVLMSVTKLAKELKMELVAEGVEREDQLEDVVQLGIDRVQGYYFCRPLPQDKMIQWLEENPAK